MKTPQFDNVLRIYVAVPYTRLNVAPISKINPEMFPLTCMLLSAATSTSIFCLSKDVFVYVQQEPFTFSCQYLNNIMSVLSVRFFVIIDKHVSLKKNKNK